MSKTNLTLAEAVAILFHNRPVPPLRPASKERWQRLRRQLRLQPIKDAGGEVGQIWSRGRFPERLQQRIEEAGQAIVEMIRRRDVEAWGRFCDREKGTGLSAMVPITDGGFLAEPLWVDPCEDVIWTEFDLGDGRLNPVDRGYRGVVINRAQFLEAIRAQRDVPRLEAEAPARSEPPRRGRRPKYDWVEFHCEITRIADKPDGLPEVQADLERMMMEWCDKKWGQAPSESMIREHVSKAYETRRKAGK